MKSEYNRKIRMWITILGVLVAILMGFMPLVGMFASSNVAYMMFIAGACLATILCVLMIVSLLLSEQIIIKLVSLPITYLIVMLGYIFYKTNFIGMIKMMLGINVESSDAIFESMSGMMDYMSLLHAGVWTLCIPVVIAGVHMMFKLRRKGPDYYKNFELASGIIDNVVDTRSRVNSVAVYDITISVEYYHGENFQVKKKFRVPAHLLHTLAIGNRVELLIDPKKRENLYIQNEYGII